MSSYYKHFGYVQAFLSKGKKAKSWRLLKENNACAKILISSTSSASSSSSTSKYHRHFLFIFLLYTERPNLQFDSRACVIQAYYLEIILHWQQVLDEVDEGHSDWLLGSLVDQSECWNSLHVFCRNFTWQINTGTRREVRGQAKTGLHTTHTHTHE